jgi:hypothetical protein
MQNVVMQSFPPVQAIELAQGNTRQLLLKNITHLLESCLAPSRPLVRLAMRGVPHLNKRFCRRERRRHWAPPVLRSCCKTAAHRRYTENWKKIFNFIQTSFKISEMGSAGLIKCYLMGSPGFLRSNISASAVLAREVFPRYFRILSAAASLSD